MDDKSSMKWAWSGHVNHLNFGGHQSYRVNVLHVHPTSQVRFIFNSLQITEQLLLSHMQARSFVGSYWKGSDYDRNRNRRQTGGIPTKKGGGKKSNFRLLMRKARAHAPATTLYNTALG